MEALETSLISCCRCKDGLEGSQEECKRRGPKELGQNLGARVDLSWENSRTRHWGQWRVRELAGLGRQRQGKNSQENFVESQMFALGRQFLTSFQLGWDQTRGSASLGLAGAGRDGAAPGSSGCVGGNYRQAPGFWLHAWLRPSATPWPHKPWTLWLSPWSPRSPLPSPFLCLGVILWFWLCHSSWLLSFSSVAQPCPTLCDPMDRSTSGLPVPHHLLEFAQVHGHWIVIPSNHLILCRPLLLLPSIFPSNRVFSNESLLHIRWPKYWSFSFSISPSNECSGLLSFRSDWFGLLAVQGTLKSLLLTWS